MNDKKIIGLVSKEQKMRNEYQKDLLESVDSFREMVQAGEIQEFVITSYNQQGEVIVTVCARNFLAAIGLYEMGKHSLMMQENGEE